MEVLTAWIDDDRWQEASHIIEAHELAAVPHSTAMPGLATFLEGIAGWPAVVESQRLIHGPAPSTNP